MHAGGWTLAAQRVKRIASWHTEVLSWVGRVEHDQLAQRDSLGRNYFFVTSPEKLDVLVPSNRLLVSSVYIV